MNELYVLAVGDVEEQTLRWAEAAAAEWFPFPVRRLPPLPTPEGSWDEVAPPVPLGGDHEGRGAKRTARRGPRVGGHRARPLHSPADLSVRAGAVGRRIALVSVCRLRQEFYGFPSDPELLRERLTKEMLHELGHTFGLTHCSRTECSMSLSTHVEAVDSKSAGWCAKCGAHLARRFTSLKGVSV